MFYHLAALNNLKADLNRRKEIFKSFLEKMNNVQDTIEAPLKWVAGPSELGFLIRSLIDGGYIDGPELKNGELNCSELSRNLFKCFSIKNHTSTTSLAAYLNSSTIKNKQTSKKFEAQEFLLPNRKSKRSSVETAIEILQIF